MEQRRERESPETERPRERGREGAMSAERAGAEVGRVGNDVVAESNRRQRRSTRRARGRGWSTRGAAQHLSRHGGRSFEVLSLCTTHASPVATPTVAQSEGEGGFAGSVVEKERVSRCCSSPPSSPPLPSKGHASCRPLPPSPPLSLPVRLLPPHAHSSSCALRVAPR